MTRKRLTAAEDQAAALRTELAQVRLAAQTVLKEKALAEQARDFYKLEAGKWEARASKFIDQIGISGTMVAPAMTEPGAAPQSDVRRVFAALGHTELPHRADAPPPPAGIIGVNEDAAREAVAAVTRT